jgi:eukaryotic-like serine/threonine-protein kinase
VVTPAQPHRRFLAPGDKLGKHEVIRQLAVGGMAELYLTRTVGIEGFEKLVCVKRILPQHLHDPTFVQMFLNEARLAATLQHPNIAQVYDIGQDLGEYFFSMEYVHGEDLGRLVASGRDNGVQISLDCALTVAAGLCAGLHHAHEKAAPDGKPLGVVHRDVSPNNVLVSYDGAVKLVDFGLARMGTEPSTSQNGLRGKIAYMSPEQCRGRVVLDRRSDVFSIGTILYELTTGQVPFVDETEYGVLHQIVNRDADPPTTLVPSYPPALEAIVMRALARDPDRRYATALELQTRLEDFAHDNRLRVSPLVLARLMSTLFPARLEEWDHARAQGAFFVEQHVVRTLIESGKTSDRAARYTPTAMPIVEARGARGEPGSAPTAPNVDPTEQTQLGPEPTLAPARATPQTLAAPARATPQTLAAPARATPQTLAAPARATPQTLAAPARATPQTLAAPARITPHPMPAQPRITPHPMPAQPRVTPHPMPAQAAPGLAAATNPSATAGGRATRSALVPNMPGAVPIVRALPAPPVPSGGTLVSSATQAGTPPPTVMPLKPPTFTPAGSGDFEPYSAASIAGSYPGPAGSHPGGFAHNPASTTAADGLTGRRSSPSLPGYHGPDDSGADDFGRETAHHTVADLNERVRAATARKTEQIRSQGPSRRPLIAIGLVGTLGAAIGVWFAVHTTPTGRPPDRAPTKASAGSVAPETPAPPSAAPPAAAPPATAAPEAHQPSARAPAPDAVAAPPVPTDEPAVAPAKKKPTRAVVQDPRPKAAKPARVRAEPKRSARGPRPEPKEEPWNNDSPLLPEPTPKR